MARGEGDATSVPQRLSAGSEAVALSLLPVGHCWRILGLDEARVVWLAHRYGDLPAVVVNRADRTVIDGAHRVAAARRLGLHVVPVEWFDGGVLAAFAEFVARNAAGGFPLSRLDREHGVRRVLAAEPEWSDRRIAHCARVSPKVVARLRAGVDGPTGRFGDRRVGRDGRVRPARPGTLGGRVAEALEASPGASLRAIASQLGVSPETVRRARVGLSRPDRAPAALTVGAGASPVRPRADGAVAGRPGGARAARSPTVGAPWHGDAAFGSTPEGTAFVAWLDVTWVGDGAPGPEQVPLGRTYEIVDEARRRAGFWSDFADSLQARARRRP